MANSTEVKGTFEFNGDFYKKEHTIIDKYFEKAKLCVDYGIEYIENNLDGSFDFEAIGRWSMENILPWCFKPFNGDKQFNEKHTIEDAYEYLLKQMKAENTSVSFFYTDYDSGMNWRKEVDAMITPTQKREENHDFDVTINSEDELGTDERSLIEDDTEEGILIEDIEPKDLHDIAVNLAIFVNNDPECNPVKIMDMKKRFIDYITNEPAYNGGFYAYHFDTKDDLYDWYELDFRNQFLKEQN